MRLRLRLSRNPLLMPTTCSTSSAARRASRFVIGALVAVGVVIGFVLSFHTF
jgi:hypothetical protein